MYLSRFVGFAAVAAALSAPLAAQGIPRGARTTQTVTNAPRLMVANPFAYAPGDSAAAVHIGTAMRQEMKDIVGRNFKQPKEGLGFDNTPVAHMWRSIATPDHPL